MPSTSTQIKFHHVATLPAVADGINGHVYFVKNAQTIYIFNGTSYEPYDNNTTYTANNGVALNGTVFSHADTSSQASVSEATRTYIKSVTLDGYGHVTGLSTGTETVTDTHYTSHLIAGTSATATADGTVAESSNKVYVNNLDNTTVRDSITFAGDGLTKVSSDSNGNIKINTPASTYGETAGSGSVTGSEVKFVKSVSLSAGHVLSGNTQDADSAITKADGSANSGIPTSAAVKSYVDSEISTAISPISTAMVFKGTAGTSGTVTSSTLPAAAAGNTGHTYKVITTGTYQGVNAKEGDTLISDGSSWVLIPSGDEPNGTVTSVTIGVNEPLSIDNSAAITTSGSRTISHKTILTDNSGTAGTYSANGSASSSSANLSLSHSGKFTVPSITVDAYGHVTGIADKVISLPASGNTDTKVTSAANHYGYTASSGKTEGTNATTITTGTTKVITSVTLDDAKHVTGVTSATLPSYPTGFSITENLSDDDVVNLEELPTGKGNNTVNIKATHAKKGPATASEAGTNTVVKGATANVTVAAGDSNKEINVPKVTVDEWGHVTALTEQTLKISVPSNTDTKVTSAANHYGYTANSGSTVGTNSSSITAGTTTVITSITLDDAKHVTGATAATLPSYPTVGDGTVTLTYADGTTDTFTLNQSAAKSVNMSDNWVEF